MSRKKSVFLMLLVLIELQASQSEALQCLDLFEFKPDHKVARLFMSPVKKVPSIADLNMPAQFLNTEKVLGEAHKELQKRVHIAKVETTLLHVDFLAAQLPSVLRMLDLVPSSEMQKTYYLIDRSAEKNKSIYSVAAAIDYLKKISQHALMQKTVTADFYTNIVMDVLAIHYKVFKNIDFSAYDQFEKYRGEIAARKNRPKFQMNDDIGGDNHVEITPLIRFLNKMLEVKQKIYLQSQDGYLLWPTFTSLGSEDFQDVHLGIKLIGITLERKLIFDGNESDFFGLAVHDITNHTVQKDLLQYKEDFTRFKNSVFNQFSTYSGVKCEILRKIWFLGTHEGSQSIFREYLLVRKQKLTPQDSVRNLTTDLVSSIIHRDVNSDINSTLSRQLKNPMFFLAEASDRIKNMNQKDLDIEVQSTWLDFLKIYENSLFEHFKYL